MFDTAIDSARAGNMEMHYITIGEKVVVPRPSNGVAPVCLEEPSNSHPNEPENCRQPSRSATQQYSRTTVLEEAEPLPDSAIAIIGMACRYPEADSLEEFWDLISAGKCAVRRMPEDRFTPSELTREPKGPFWGGYVRRLDSFDHRFFGISGREAKSMDPQQRLCLQVAYEAIESSGYYGLRSQQFNHDVGCYIGVANDDYVANVASHPVNAFSAMGTLRAFISGRISHFFGWTGPAITLDTACSAAAVAIHTACKVCLH